MRVTMERLMGSIAIGIRSSEHRNIPENLIEYMLTFTAVVSNTGRFLTSCQ
jgi:hypothetical protein